MAVEALPERGAHLSLATKLSYGFFRFADVLVMSTVGRFLIVFYTINLKVSPFHIAFAQPLIKLLDVATDPLIGGLSDRTESRFGRLALSASNDQ